MYPVIIAVHVLVSLFLIFVILLQPGRADGMAAFGGGGSASSVFGGRGSVTFLAKVTEVCAVIFMITSLTLAYRSSHTDSVLRARRNIAAQDAAEKKPATPPLPTGQTAPAPATGGAAVPVPGNQASGPEKQTASPPARQPAKTDGAKTAPAPAPANPNRK